MPTASSPPPRNIALTWLRVIAILMILMHGMRFISKSYYFYLLWSWSSAPWAQPIMEHGSRAPWVQIGIPLAGLLAGLLMLKPGKWLFVPLLAHFFGSVGFLIYLSHEIHVAGVWRDSSVLGSLLLSALACGLALRVLRRRRGAPG
jgi:hypothetical protein